jgi:AcrR family transcriptional regulator
MARAFDTVEKEVIAERLLEAGERLFGRYGLRKTRIEEITREAGISKGSFYTFYKSKELLCFAILERIQSRQREAMLSLAKDGKGSAADRLEGVIRVGLQMLNDTPLLRVMLEKEEYAQMVRGIPQDRIAREYADDTAFLERIISIVGARPAVSPEIATGLIRAVFFVAMNAREIAPASEQTLVDALVRILTRGLFSTEGQR